MFRYKNYLLCVLVLILACNYLDRIALGLLLQNIKNDLGMSDTQLGLLSGIAFALFYAVMGIPIARWADRGNRVTIIAATTALWSVTVALCGTAGTFIQLMCIRVGVAVGEAGCFPPAYSLIADHFSRAERPRAVAIYMLGIPLSMVGGFFFAGWMNELFGWRTTFMILGMPGLFLAALSWATLREPRCGSSPAADSLQSQMFDTRTSPQHPNVRAVCMTLWANRTFRHLLVGWSVLSFFGYGIWQWQPAFFVRTYGLQTGELGTWFAIIWGGGGLLGTLLGGELASRHAPHNESLQLKALAVVYCGFGALSTCMYLSQSLYLALTLMGISAIGITTANGPFFATIQTLIPERMRAMAISLIYLFANLIGMGLGPLVAGMLSDAFQPIVGGESLRYALLALSPGYLWGAWHLWKASETINEDLNLAPAAFSQDEPTTLKKRARTH
ncbi:spinster family MFS transporter [Peristeroidobacter soli]|uniref:spinster family MFS transporter n=1 Tax=Peristeroidobacter soli TaxID=2497877 RepID=UPI00101D24E5|nr:MFS transporter [Peristeroidobacter soli]